MKLDGVAAFVAVADNRPISEAARRLRLSKSAVSERLVELERALGTSLMRRNPLTDDGLAFLERARRLCGGPDSGRNRLPTVHDRPLACEHNLSIAAVDGAPTALGYVLWSRFSTNTNAR